jgi:hypothetical protein
MSTSNHPIGALSQRRFARITLVVLLALLVQLFAPLIPPPAVRAAEPPAPTTLSGSPPAATLGQPYSYRFRLGGGGTDTVVVVDNGSLPLGLTLAPDGTLSGTPINGGTYGFTLWAGNEAGVATTLPVLLDVRVPEFGRSPASAAAAVSVLPDPVPAPWTPIQASMPVAVSAAELGSADPHLIAADTALAGAAAPAAELSAWTRFWMAVGDGLHTFFGALGRFFSPTAAASELPQGQTPNFGAPSTLNDTNPSQVAIADFDGDGLPDLAVAHNGAARVSVWRNTTPNGATSASFAAPVVLTPTGAATSGWGIITADVNGDGRPDIALADGTRQVTIWPNTSVPGAELSFATALGIPLPGLTNPRFLTAGDFNSDGRLDIAVSNHLNGTGTLIAIALNTTPTGSFTPSFGGAESLTVPAGVAGIVAADLNGDNLAELIFATATTLSILTNTSDPGDSSVYFDERLDLALPAAGWEVAVADLNADGRLDLVVGYNAGTINASVFRNTTAAGAFFPTFATRSDIGTSSSGFREVALADVNGDARIDLLLRNDAANVRVFANTTLADAEAISVASPVALTAGSGSGDLAAADLNNDGNHDLVAANGAAGTISLFMNVTAPPPTATPSPTNTPTNTATPTNTPTATVIAPTATPQSGGSNTQNVVNVRVWADNFATAGGITTATGNVGIGSINASAPYYFVGTSASWTGSGPISLSGTLRPNGGTAFANGTFSVNTTTGAVTGGTAALSKLGNSNLNLSNVTFSVNVLQTAVTINATVALSLPENAGKTLAITYQIGQNDAYSTPNPPSLALKVAGGDLLANVQATSSGLSAATVQYTLPGITALTLNNLLIDGVGTTGMRFGNGLTFPLPNIDLGFNRLLLNNLQGTLVVSNNLYVINLTGGLSINGLPESPVPITPPVQNLRIAQGAVAGNVSDITLKVGGNPLVMKSVTIQRINGGYRLVAATATFTWPAAWGTSTSDLQNVAILTVAPFLEIGGGTQTFTVPNGFPLGGPNATVKVIFDQISAKVNYLQQQNQWGVDLTLRITFNFGNDQTVVQGAQFTLANGIASGAINNLTLKIAGLNLQLNQLAYNNATFSANAAVLTLPGVWKGANINVNSVTITSSAVNLGSAGGIFPIPDQTLGKVVKLSGMSGKVNIAGNGSYSIAVNVGTVTFSVGSDTSTVSNVLFTIANGAVSALIANAALKVAGLGVTVTNLAYTNGNFSVGSVLPITNSLSDPSVASLVPGTVKLALPGAWKGTVINLEGLDVGPDTFKLGGAGGTFPIPDQTLGKAIKLTKMTGKVNVNLNTNSYTLGVTVGELLIIAGSETSKASNVQFTISAGAPTASIGSMALKVAGLNVNASQISYANGTFSAGTATIVFPAAWKNTSVSVSTLKITNELISIGGAGSTFTIPDINLGTTGVLKLTQNKGSLTVLGNGQYQFSISSIVAISKVETSGGGNNLTVAGTLKITNGAVSGSISALAFKVSGVDFSATNMQFVGDKLTVQQAKLALTIVGKKTEATIYGLEIGGTVGFKFQGAQVLLPEFKIGAVGVKGAMIKFVAQNDGSYLVEGAAEFVFTEFKVKGSFKIGYSPATGVSLKSVKLTFEAGISSGLAIPLGNTGMGIIKISGGFDLSDGSVIITMGMGMASYVAVANIALFELDASITLTIKPSFSLKASAGAKVVGLQVATVDLYISPVAFQLKGTIQIAIVKASIEITFGKDASNQFTFYGKFSVEVTIPRGYICGEDDWCPTFPRSDTKLASAVFEGGKFKKNSSVIWGARGKVTVLGFSFHAWARVSPKPIDFGLSDTLHSYTPVKPIGVTIASNIDLYNVTVTQQPEYLIIMEVVDAANRNNMQEPQIVAPNGLQYTKQLAYVEPDGSIRIYRLEFADPAAAVGQWSLSVPKGNVAGMFGADPGPQLNSFSACAGAICLDPATTTELENGTTLAVDWSATTITSDATVQVYAESSTGMRYPIATQETTGTQVNGSEQWTLGLPSDTYTVVVEVESDGFAPLQVAQGRILINDTTPPAAPTGLSATVGSDMSALATWNDAAAEADVAGYEFAINGSEPIAINGRLSEYVTYGLTPGQTHTISVAAYDMSGNVGPAATVMVTTPGFGVVAAWPLGGIEEAVSEIGASFNEPITLESFTLVDGDGNAVPGLVAPFIADVNDGPPLVLGAAYVPAAGGLPIGSYTATITATNAVTGERVQHSWTFITTADGRQSTTLYLPLMYR